VLFRTEQGHQEREASKKGATQKEAMRKVLYKLNHTARTSSNKWVKNGSHTESA